MKYFRAAGGKFTDEICSGLTCPVCELTVFPIKFMMRGVCLNSSVDKYFVMLDSSLFTGFIYSKIKFSSNNKRWEIVRITNEYQVLAYMDKSDEHFPTGTHHWYFEDVECTDPGEKWRSLNLHMDVKKPENFCCHDGTCIPSELVCNNFADCEDKTDEHHCQFLHFREYGNITDRPPTEFEFGKKKLLDVNVSFIVLKLFEINDVEGTFDIHFMVHVEWFDKGSFNKEKLYEGNMFLCSGSAV